MVPCSEGSAARRFAIGGFRFVAFYDSAVIMKLLEPVERGARTGAVHWVNAPGVFPGLCAPSSRILPLFVRFSCAETRMLISQNPFAFKGLGDKNAN